MVTTHTLPSLPGCISSIRARGHLVGLETSPCMQTSSPACKFGEGRFHFNSRCRLVKYSVDQRFQRCHTKVWQRCQHCNNDNLWNGWGGSSKASMGPSIKKWPGVRASISSSSCGRGVNGLELRHASIWVNTVVSSSYERRTSPTMRRKWRLKLLMAASHNPPKKTDTEQIITDFCVEHGIQWNFIPEHAPHFKWLRTWSLFWGKVA